LAASLMAIAVKVLVPEVISSFLYDTVAPQLASG
jgi:hypothetical protein